MKVLLDKVQLLVNQKTELAEMKIRYLRAQQLSESLSKELKEKESIAQQTECDVLTLIAQL